LKINDNSRKKELLKDGLATVAGQYRMVQQF